MNGRAGLRALPRFARAITIAGSVSGAIAFAFSVASLHCNPVLDVGYDYATDGASDVIAGACNVNDGLCRPGEGCSIDSCTRCVCDDTHAWLCTSSCPDVGSDCPPGLPKERTACTALSVACPYANGCADPDVAVCLGGSWRVFPHGCARDHQCPPTAPLPDEPCHDPIARCTWMNDCGVSFIGSCNGDHWLVSPPMCLPGSCPRAVPSARAPCGGLGLECEWTNDCGSEDYAICTDAGWSVKTSCALQCPSEAPSAGAPCSGEETKCSWPAGCAAGSYLEATCTAGQWLFAPGCR